MSVSSSPRVVGFVLKYPCSFCWLEDHEGGTSGRGHYYDKWDHEFLQFQVVRGTRRERRAETQRWWTCGECRWKYFDYVRAYGYPHIRMFADLRRNIRSMPNVSHATYDCLLSPGNVCALGACVAMAQLIRRLPLPADLRGMIRDYVSSRWLQVYELVPLGGYPTNPQRLCDYCFQLVVVRGMRPGSKFN